ncbi:hypothetical protein HMN09_00408100 [Mycena chlorophos]|uniref:Uncharacterized protein n=1 Tax=Mycena chlorophos TaxID=658473 RepID=A0A8H6TJ99_MYCCL|nr:hypothetical protein HMN09_00408100 [Mycena chlorophos]
MVFCSECGTPGEGRFCTECGNRLDAVKQSSQPTSPTPSYNAYGGEMSSGGVGPSTPASESASSGGPSNIRRVAGAGVGNTNQGGTTAGGTTSGGTSSPSYGSGGFISQPAQQESTTALFGSQGYRLEPFHVLARDLFIALDQTTYPVGTQLMEASKIRRFREVAGRPVPPYFETHVLPMYYQTLGAQCAGTNVLTWEGWNTYLAHKILSNPDEMFSHIGAAVRGLNIQLPWPLLRTSFPSHAYADAAARELQFQQNIRNLAGAAIGGGGMYGGFGGGRYGSGGGGSGLGAAGTQLAVRGISSLISQGLFN